MKTVVILPTIPERQEIYNKFIEHWQPLFDKHNVHYLVVEDGDNPVLHDKINDFTYQPKEVMGDFADVLSNHNAGIRNLGFAYVAKYLKDAEMILTLDDDCLPINDPIQDHIDALRQSVPVSWMSTMINDYSRGFPYGIRDEAEVVLSHGIWHKVADWDAPTQLVKGAYRQVEFYKGIVPKGVLFPVCAMNMAFKPQVLPWIFQAPWAYGIHRFDDIFAGITAKKAIDENGWAAVTGYAAIEHDRASNVFTNLKNEAPGIELNETYWQGDESHEYFKLYNERLKRWQEFLNTI